MAVLVCVYLSSGAVVLYLHRTGTRNSRMSQSITTKMPWLLPRAPAAVFSQRHTVSGEGDVRSMWSEELNPCSSDVCRLIPSLTEYTDDSSHLNAWLAPDMVLCIHGSNMQNGIVPTRISGYATEGVFHRMVCVWGKGEWRMRTKTSRLNGK